MRFKRVNCIFWLCLLAWSAWAQTYKTVSGVPYRSGSSDIYASERCKLDIYYPEDTTGVPTVVWFHGGGLTGGERFIPRELKQCGLIVVAVNYRLLPKATLADCIDDAAAAVAWTFGNIARYGGETGKIFVAGHSAGGYLTGMIGLDKRWLARYGMDADSIAGLIPFSGHAISHFAYREQRGMKATQPSIDEMAPLYYVRPDAPPLVLVTGDREEELLGRYEEVAYLYRMMKVNGHTRTFLYELAGHDHGSMVGPAFHILKKHVSQIVRQADGAAR